MTDKQDNRLKNKTQFGEIARRDLVGSSAAAGLAAAGSAAGRYRPACIFWIASNETTRQPDAEDKLREAFAAAKVPAEIEVRSDALHGWWVPDMPAAATGPIYS